MGSPAVCESTTEILPRLWGLGSMEVFKRSIQSATIGVVVTLTKPRQPREIALAINGRTVRIQAGATVAAAVLHAGEACRVSGGGELRAPLCGMGICMECRATVDGVAHVRTCQLPARDGMSVVTE